MQRDREEVSVGDHDIVFNMEVLNCLREVEVLKTLEDIQLMSSKECCLEIHCWILY